MQFRDLIPWSRKESELARRTEEDHPILGLQREMNRVFERFWNRFERPFAAFDNIFGVGSPRTDVVETDKAIEVSVELPGLDEKDIEVTLADDALTIKGEKKAEHEENRKGYYLSERTYGSFYRTIPLPSGVATDDVKAEFRKGVLTVTLPKTPEAQAKVKRIEVKGG